MAPEKTPKNQEHFEFIIKTPSPENWRKIAALIARSIPNALISKLGLRFGAIYYKNIASHQLSCSYAAFTKDGELAGVIIGTIDHELVQKPKLSIMIRLLLASNFRILSPSAFRWLLHGWRTKNETKHHRILFPKAELMILTVDEKYRGNHLANRLIEKLESFYNEKNIKDTYLILTEESNQAANYLYEKIGARFIKTYSYHGKRINAWEKGLS